jgi:hypothetical protein
LRDLPVFEHFLSNQMPLVRGGPEGRWHQLFHRFQLVPEGLSHRLDRSYLSHPLRLSPRFHPLCPWGQQGLSACLLTMSRPKDR